MIRPTTSFCLHPDLIEEIKKQADYENSSRSRFVERTLARALGLDEIAGDPIIFLPPPRRRWGRRS